MSDSRAQQEQNTSSVCVGRITGEVINVPRATTVDRGPWTLVVPGCRLCRLFETKKKRGRAFWLGGAGVPQLLQPTPLQPPPPANAKTLQACCLWERCMDETWHSQRWASRLLVSVMGGGPGSSNWPFFL